jgi:nucleoid DNA-binding protein
MAKKATGAIKDALTKSQLMGAIAEETGLTKKDVAGVFESLNDILQRHLKKGGAEQFTLPGVAKFRVRKKAARKARKGVNPFTGEEIMISAKPASRVVKITPLKSLKDAV